jgi:hypothetical protein
VRVQRRELDVLKRSAALLAVVGILVLVAGCSDPDAYPGGGRAQTLPVEGGEAPAAGDDASPEGDGGTFDTWHAGYSDARAD